MGGRRVRYDLALDHLYANSYCSHMLQLGRCVATMHAVFAYHVCSSVHTCHAMPCLMGEVYRFDMTRLAGFQDRLWNCMQCLLEDAGAIGFKPVLPQIQVLESSLSGIYRTQLL